MSRVGILCAASLLVFLALFVARPAPGMDVTLKVQETAGVPRVKDPCRSGIPLVPGAVKEEGKLRLLDEKGAEVPAQFRVINRRPEGDIEWVCVDFLADVAANATSVYRLTDGGQPKSVASPVKVDDAADAVTVVSGPLKLVVSKKTFAGLGEVWLDRDGDGKFADDERVASGGALAIEGMDGRTYRSTADLTGPLTVAMEEQGPLHVVVRIDGEMKAQSADGKSHHYPLWSTSGDKMEEDLTIPNADRTLGFTARIHVWKDQTWVQTFVTVRVPSGQTRGWYDSHHEQSDKIQFGTYFAESARLPGNFLVEAVNLDLDLARRTVEYRIGGGANGDQVHSGKLAAGTAGITLYQDTPADWFWQAFTGRIFDPLLKDNAERMKKLGKDKAFHEEFASQPHPAGETWGKRLLIDRDGYRFIGYRLYENAQTAKTDGGANAEGRGKPAAEGMRAPGWVEVSDGRTTVTAGCRWFWQMCPKSVEVRPGTVTFGLWPREFSRGHLFEGRVHRTHEMIFDFRPTGKGLEAERRFAAFDRRLVAWPGARQNLASGAYGEFPLYPMQDWPRYEKSALSAVACGADEETLPGAASSIEIEREKYDHYGVWKFGGCVEVAWHQFSQYHELDLLYCLMVHFARTGDYRFFREAEILMSLLADIPAYGGGYGHQGASPFHYYMLGPSLVSSVSGDRRLRDAVLHGYTLAMPDPARPADGHAAANPGFSRPEPRRLDVTAVLLWANLDALHLYFPECRGRAVEGLKGSIARWRNVAPDVQATDKAFQYTFGFAADAAGRYAEVFRDDADVRVALVKACRAWKAEFEKKSAGERTKAVERISAANGFAYAARLGADASLLDFAAELARDADFSPNYRTGTSSAKTWTQFGHRLTQVFLHDWDRKQHPEKYKDLP